MVGESTRLILSRGTRQRYRRFFFPALETGSGGAWVQVRNRASGPQRLRARLDGGPGVAHFRQVKQLKQYSARMKPFTPGVAVLMSFFFAKPALAECEKTWNSRSVLNSTAANNDPSTVDVPTTWKGPRGLKITFSRSAEGWRFEATGAGLKPVVDKTDQDDACQDSKAPLCGSYYLDELPAAVPAAAGEPSPVNAPKVNAPKVSAAAGEPSPVNAPKVNVQKAINLRAGKEGDDGVRSVRLLVTTVPAAPEFDTDICRPSTLEVACSKDLSFCDENHLSGTYTRVPAVAIAAAGAGTKRTKRSSAAGTRAGVKADDKPAAATKAK